MTKEHRKNLVILRAGDSSLHRRWTSQTPRDFDLFISYYGQTAGLHEADAEYWEHRPGPKWSCIADLLEAHPGLLERYEAFWFPDDDLDADTGTLNRMFALFHGLQFKLAQPALTRDSYYSWELLLQQPGTIARQVAFVEVMAPLFTRDSLRSCLHSLRSSRSGWGLDWVWPKLLGGSLDGRVAVIDATPVKHTRPIGGGDLYKKNPELDPNNDSRRLAAEHDIGVERFTHKFVVHQVLRFAPQPWLQRVEYWFRRLNAQRLGNRRMSQGK
jgi:Protein of unknown function (DUF707)